MEESQWLICLYQWRMILTIYFSIGETHQIRMKQNRQTLKWQALECRENVAKKLLISSQFQQKNCR
jgi:hypothetical protein